MNVDIAALRAVEKEKGIEFGSLIDTLETALLTAYRHTLGHAGHARVEIDRKTGAIRVWAQETAQTSESTDEVVREWDDTPEDFGRIAATTARQVILQRLRDVDNERTFGDFAGREHDLITGTVSADA
jgi:N utilization substance protein A